jgi:hypothetical protein
LIEANPKAGLHSRGEIMSKQRDSEVKDKNLSKSNSREPQTSHADVDNQDIKSQDDYQDSENPMTQDMKESREQAIQHNHMHKTK